MSEKYNTNINSIEEAIKQLEDLKEDRLSFVTGDKEHDNIFLKDVQAIEIVLGNLEALADMQKSADKELENAKMTIEKLKEENLHWRGQYYLVTRKIGVLPKQKIKDAIEKIAEYKIARSTNKGYYYDYFINQDYKEDFIKLFNKLLED